MTASPRRYDDWTAPAADGDVLIWPSPSQLFSELHDNVRLLAAAGDVRIQNLSLPTWRQITRTAIGHRESQGPLVVSGHQTELYHAGVWAKLGVIDAAARRVGGRALHIAVDTDSPKHLQVRWPGGACALAEPGINAAWAGKLPPPSPEPLNSIRRDLAHAAADWNFTPLWFETLEALQRCAPRSTSLAGALMEALRETDHSLGLDYSAQLASSIWSGRGFRVLAHHLLANADRFALHYNAALQGYRDAQGIKTHQRPMPDLAVSEEAVEAPFWLDDLAGGLRSRPSVFRDGDGWILSLVNGSEFRFDPRRDALDAADALEQWLSGNNQRLSPRALTLTLFVRLGLADYFVHGIGGGRYDQVTDRIIATHFGLRPPAFGVVTATLYFPLSVGKARACVPCVLQEGHQLRHRLLGRQKMELVQAIAGQPRRSPRRKALFLEMRQSLRAAEEQSQPMRQWRTRLEETLRQFHQEQALFDRELAYPIQPRARLDRLRERLSAALG